MKRIRLVKFVTLMMMTGLLSSGFISGSTCSASDKDVPSTVAQQKKEASVLKGKIGGVSTISKSISMVVGKGKEAKTMLVRFNDDTKGMEYAKKGEAAIIAFEVKDNYKFATVIKPKLAKLPKGVTEMQPEDLGELVALGPEKGKYFLVDSRPAKRYAEGHVPTAVSIPVKMMQEKGAELLPADKDYALIFHCGGPT